MYEHADIQYPDISPVKPIFCYHGKYEQIKDPLWDMHYAIEIGVVLSGKVTRYHESKEMVLGPGGIWFCGSCEPHGYEIMETTYESLAFLIDPSFLINETKPEMETMSWLEPFQLAKSMAMPISSEEFLRIALDWREWEETADPEIMMMKTRITVKQLLLTALKKIREQKFDSDIKGIPSYNNKISEAIRIVMSSRSLLYLDELASHCGMSKNRFNDRFREMTGYSFAKFALRYRLAQAARDLIVSNEGLDQLAERWGFTDKSHFCNRFKATYQLTPLEYRNRHRSMSR